MYIQSQNEEIIMNWNNVYLIKAEPNVYVSNDNYQIVVYNNFGDKEVIGNYSSKENALQVINELTEFITTKDNYILPSNEEVEEIWEITSQKQDQQP